MQTFLPYEDFTASAEALDTVRLGNQRNETLVIARSIRSGRGWPNHAVTRQWSRWLPALLAYGRVVCRVYEARTGTPDTVSGQLTAIGRGLGLKPGMPVDLPDWLGEPEFHRSHRRNLIRKDEAGDVRPGGWYMEQWPEERWSDFYWYPTHHGYEWDDVRDPAATYRVGPEDFRKRVAPSEERKERQSNRVNQPHRPRRIISGGLVYEKPS